MGSCAFRGSGRPYGCARPSLVFLIEVFFLSGAVAELISWTGRHCDTRRWKDKGSVPRRPLFPVPRPSRVPVRVLAGLYPAAITRGVCAECSFGRPVAVISPGIGEGARGRHRGQGAFTVPLSTQPSRASMCARQSSAHPAVVIITDQGTAAGIDNRSRDIRGRGVHTYMVLFCVKKNDCYYFGRYRLEFHPGDWSLG